MLENLAVTVLGTVTVPVHCNHVVIIFHSNYPHSQLQPSFLVFDLRCKFLMLSHSFCPVAQEVKMRCLSACFSGIWDVQSRSLCSASTPSTSDVA